MRKLRSVTSIFLLICLLFCCMAGLTGCSGSETLFTVSGTAITEGYFSLYMYEYLSVMAGDLGDNMVSSSDQVTSSVTVGDYVKDLIYKRIVNDYAIMALGKELGITYNSTDKQNAASYRSDFTAILESNGSSLRSLKKTLNMTESDLDLFCDNVALVSRIQEALYAETSPYYPSETQIQNITDDFHENYICITYVIQSTTNSDGEVLSDAQLQISRDECEAARKAFLAGDNVADIVKKYSEDASGREEPYTVYFTLETIEDEEVLKAVRTMGIGDVSDIVETETGYMIIKRLPLDDTQISSLITEYMEENIDSRITTLSDSATVVKTTAFDSFKMAF